MTLILLGLALWWGAHLFKRLAPARRAGLGEPGKGLMTVLILLGVVLMVLGYRGSDWLGLEGAAFVELWSPPRFLVHVNNLLMIFAFYLYAASGMKTRITRLIRHPQNMGLGAAIRTGLKAASLADGVVVTLDADNSQGPELIREMIAKIEAGADVVIASRFQPGAQEVGVPPHRKFLSHLSSGAIRVLAPYPGARDYTCGFRAYRVEVLRQLIGRYGDAFVRENGFSCMLELLLNLRRIGATVAEVPLVLRYDLKQGASKMRIFRTMWRYVVTITRGWLPLAPVWPDTVRRDLPAGGDPTQAGSLRPPSTERH